jgi:hypothetical protein
MGLPYTLSLASPSLQQQNSMCQIVQTHFRCSVLALHIINSLAYAEVGANSICRQVVYSVLTWGTHAYSCMFTSTFPVCVLYVLLHAVQCVRLPSVS